MPYSRENFEKFIQKLTAEIQEGLRHGFFEYRLTSEIIKDGKRQLILEAGKKYKFIICADEVIPPAGSDR